MSKRKRKGRHAKGQGPGGPSRPRQIGGSRRVTAPGGAPPTKALVDSLLGGFQPLDADADLASELPMTRQTYQNKAKKIREVLGLAKGDCIVEHPRTRD